MEGSHSIDHDLGNSIGNKRGGGLSLAYPKDFVNRVICGDCVKVMKSIPDNIIDLVVTSPPYDDLRDYNGFSFDFKGIA